jgi:hypothetical protein
MDIHPDFSDPVNNFLNLRGTVCQACQGALVFWGKSKSNGLVEVCPKLVYA